MYACAAFVSNKLLADIQCQHLCALYFNENFHFVIILSSAAFILNNRYVMLFLIYITINSKESVFIIRFKMLHYLCVPYFRVIKSAFISAEANMFLHVSK